MDCGSVSILSSTSLFPANSNINSSSSITFVRSLNLSKPNPRFYRKTFPFKLRALFNQSATENDGSIQQFLKNNSVADFMRFKRDNNGNIGELQTAVVSYRKKFPWSLLQPFLQVDLVSTVHIADKEYFALLQKELESYDCVLYEMVTSKESLENRSNTPNTKRLKSSRSRSRGFNIVGFIQRQFANLLMLDFQLDFLDYQRQNWYHADLDYETFKLLQVEKGESLFSLAREVTLETTKMTLETTKAMEGVVPISEDLSPLKSKLLWASRRLPMPLVGLLVIGSICSDTGSQEYDAPELEALSRLDFSAAMKIFLAKLFTSDLTDITAAVDEKSVIIGERNRVAAEAVQRSISEGNNKIAVLYGGGHMPDLGRRLREEFNLVPTRVQWVTAWSIRKGEIESGSLPFLKTMAEISGWPLNRYQTLALVIFSSVLAADLVFWELCFDAVVDWIPQAISDVSHFVDNL